MIVFLELNGRHFSAPEEELVQIVTGVAGGNISEAALARWLRRWAAGRATSA